MIVVVLCGFALSFSMFENRWEVRISMISWWQQCWNFSTLVVKERLKQMEHTKIQKCRFWASVDIRTVDCLIDNQDQFESTAGGARYVVFATTHNRIIYICINRYISTVFGHTGLLGIILRLRRPYLLPSMRFIHSHKSCVDISSNRKPLETLVITKSTRQKRCLQMTMPQLMRVQNRLSMNILKIQQPWYNCWTLQPLDLLARLGNTPCGENWDKSGGTSSSGPIIHRIDVPPNVFAPFSIRRS